MDDLIWPGARYPESFLLISLLKVCQELGDLYGGTGMTSKIPVMILEDKVILVDVVEERIRGHGFSYFSPTKKT